MNQQKKIPREISQMALEIRPSSVRCAGDKALKDRWTSVGKTGKLTDAMRLVAAAKVPGGWILWLIILAIRMATFGCTPC